MVWSYVAVKFLRVGAFGNGISKFVISQSISLVQVFHPERQLIFVLNRWPWSAVIFVQIMITVTTATETSIIEAHIIPAKLDDFYA